MTRQDSKSRLTLVLCALWCVVSLACGSSPTSPSPTPTPTPTPPTLPAVLWTRSGTGNTVIDLPAYVTRLRITGQYSQNSSNFIIWCGSQLVINELLGTGWNTTTYAGTHQLSAPGCSARIENSTGVAWSLTEVR